MTTGENIGRLAREKGINLHKLSDKANIPYTTLYSIVKRKSDKIDMETLKKIALALDLHPVEIMGDSSASMVLYGMELLERSAPEAFKATFGNGGAANVPEWEEVPVEEVCADQQAFLDSRMKKAFSALNETGQTVACERVEELAKIDDYKRTEPPETLSGDSEGSCTSQREKPSERPSSPSGSK